MNRILRTFFLIGTTICPSLCLYATPADANETGHTNYLIRAVSTEHRAEFAGFIDNVLRIVPSQAFFALADKIHSKCPPRDDQELYKQLIKHVPSITPFALPYHRLASLRHQKDVLNKQICELIGDKKQINGAIEIGSPATYLSTLSQPITGDVYVINDAEKLTDRLQCNGRRPNNKFVPLNDYVPIPEDTIPSNSVDLIICFIGLHHCPREKLADFTKSIARVLRPGGIFLLRDHDVTTEKTMIMAHAAHSTFNVIIADEPLQNEVAEYRNFQPINHWITLLEEHGFTVGSERLLQEGDPSLNTMIKCIKRARNHAEQLAMLEHDKQTNTQFTRPVIMSQDPEWINVDLAKEYAQFLNHTPWYDFPYYASAKAYWNVFFSAWKQARKKQSFWNVMTSDAMMTNATVGAFTTIEFLAKSIAAYPARWASAGTAQLRVQMIIRDPMDQIEQLSPAVKVLEVREPFKVVEAPRYTQFLAMMQQFMGLGIEIENIAGQKSVLCKIRHPFDCPTPATVDSIIGRTSEYRWTLPTQPRYAYATYCIDVNRLKSTISACSEQGIEFLYIHESRDA